MGNQFFGLSQLAKGYYRTKTEKKRYFLKKDTPNSREIRKKTPQSKSLKKRPPLDDDLSSKIFPVVLPCTFNSSLVATQKQLFLRACTLKKKAQKRMKKKAWKKGGKTSEKERL